MQERVRRQIPTNLRHNTFLQLSKNVGESMLERFWAAWESQKRIDSQRYQARALRHLQPPVREPICGLDGLGFLKSFFVVLTEKDMTPSANTPRTSFFLW
jgi:hypothetical protein